MMLSERKVKIVNLASGSKGNSTLICTDKTKVLVDVGISESKLKKRLSEVGENIGAIDAIFITHEHCDHILGLESILKKRKITVFVHKKLLKSGVFDKYNSMESFVPFDCEKFEYKGLEVVPFETSHDSICPVGFTFSVCGSKSKVGFLTDTGAITEQSERALLGSKIVFLETNYDEQMLENGTYPERLKRRIAGAKGHLSNSDSLDFAVKLFASGTKCFVLSHISQNNNTGEIAYAKFASFFESQGLVLDKDLFIRLSFQDKHGNNFNLKEEF